MSEGEWYCNLFSYLLALMDGDYNEGGAAASHALIFFFFFWDSPNASDAAAARRCSAPQWTKDVHKRLSW